MLNKFILISVSILGFFGKIYSQQIIEGSKEANFINYSTQEGLPANEIFKIYESSNGYIWICTRYGATKFDGINFETYTEKDGLPSSAVMSACEDNNGNMWFGTSKGLAVLINNKITSFDSTFKLPNSGLRGITKLKDGTLWLASVNHVFHINPDHIKSPLIKKYAPNEKLERLVFRDVWQNKRGQIIAGSDAGCFYLRNDSLVRYNNLRSAVYQMVEMENDVEWFCAWMEPIRVFKNGKYSGQIDLGSGTLSMIKDSKGNVWIATWDKGVFKYNGKNFINYSAKQGLYFNSFWGVNEDSYGNIWLSSWGAGLFKYSGESFTRITDKSGLPNNNTGEIVEAPDGKIWIATDQSVSSYDKHTGKIQNFTTCNGKKLSLIYRLYVHNANEIWCLGYIGKGYKIINDKITEIEDLAGYDVEKDENGVIWISTDDRGLIKISDEGKQVFDSKKAHGDSRVAGIYRDTKNNLWLFNHRKGIDIFYKNDILNISRKDGFLDEHGWDMVEDAQGYYWISVNKKGVYKCSLEPNHKIKILDSLTANEDLKTEAVNTVLISKNILYMSSINGLMAYDLSSKGKKIIKRFGKDDGLLSIDCVLQFTEEDGKIWLTTPKGIFCFDPSQIKPNKFQTKTHITGLKLFFETPDWSLYSKGIDSDNLPENLILPYQKNHLTFSFIGINMPAPTKVLYQYKLEGVDADWSPAADRKEASYPNIAPGTYTFMVKSCNNDGIWNDEATTYIFTITPPFWRTTWFLTLAVISSILLLYFIIKYREKQLQKDKIVLEEKIHERTYQLKEAFKQIEEKNKEITDSINYASNIQAALLPSYTDIEFLTKDFFIVFNPKDIVSGDFYWAERKDNLFYIAVCDSTGHGVPGAFMSLLNLNFINEAVNEKNYLKPNEIFNYVRNELVSSISKEGQKDGFDGTLICFDKNNKRFTYSAANTKPILIRNGEMTILLADKMPVGKGEKQDSFSLHHIQYQSGDTLYLFTDGYADQFGGEKGKKMKQKKLEETLLAIHHLPMNKQSEILNHNFQEWKGDLEQVDDVCLIGIRL